MKKLTEKIKELMSQYRITSYTIAKNANISQSHLSMIFNGKRSMKPAQFYAIIEQIPMPLTTKNALTDDFCKLYFTEERYLSIKYINQLFKHLSDLTSCNTDNKSSLIPQKNETNLKDTVYKGTDIAHIVNILLLNEFAAGTEAVYIYLPCTEEGNVLRNSIDTIIKNHKFDTKLFVLVDYLGNPQNGAANIEALKNLLPLALSDDSDSYRFYAANVSFAPSENYSTPYPYFIALSDRVIFINSACDEIMLHSDPAVVKSVITRCEGRIKHYVKCIETNTNVYNMITEVVLRQGYADSFLSLEYEPCLAMHFSDDIVKAVVHPDLPIRDRVIELSCKRLEQLRCIKKSTRIFNKDALMDFARTGIIYELAAYSRPLSPSERLRILQGLYECAKGKNHTLLALNPSNLLLSDRVSMYQSNDFVLFSIWNSDNAPHKYCSLYEKSIYNSFADFINYLTDSSYVYSKAETLEFIEAAIKYTETLCKS